MANKKDTTYFGLTGGQAWFVVILLAALITLAGYGPLADEAGTATTVINTSGSTSTGTNDGDLSLNTEFVSASINGTTIATDAINYDPTTDTVSLQFDAYVNTGVANYTIFEVWSKDTSGTAFLVSSDNETGSLSLPVTDKSMQMSVLFTASVLAGFADTQEVEYASVSASCNQLYDDAGEKFFPLSVRTGSSVLPNIKIDGIYDTKSYSWVATTTTQTINVTCNVSYTGVATMDDISDKLVMPVVLECGDDSPITVEIIRNDAIKTA